MKKALEAGSSRSPSWVLQGIALGFIGLLITIVLAANQRRLPLPLQFLANLPFGDTLGHFILMGLLAFLCNLAWPVSPWRWEKLKPLRIPKATLIIIAIVTLEEMSQFLIPARTPSWIDLGADYLGIFLFGEWGYRWGNSRIE